MTLSGETVTLSDRLSSADDRIDWNTAEEIVAVRRRQRHRQRIPILDVPVPARPPAGWEWIEAYRYWSRGYR